MATSFLGNAVIFIDEGSLATNASLDLNRSASFCSPVRFVFLSQHIFSIFDIRSTFLNGCAAAGIPECVRNLQCFRSELLPMRSFAVTLGCVP